MATKWILLCVLGCGGSTTSTTPSTNPTPASGGSATTTFTPPEDNPVATAPAPGGSSADAPEISRSVGVANGVVILWPRIPGSAKDPDTRQIAEQIQSRLKVLVERARPGQPVDVRPEPERVCPRAGCVGLAVGSLLLRHEGGCAVVVTISASGPSEARLVPWVGAVELKQKAVPFREAAEAAVTVTDYEGCPNVGARLEPAEKPIEEAIKRG